MASPRGFQRATVARVVSETADARTFVLEPHEGPFTYRAGQFCTFKVTVNGKTLFRSYSMSSAPEHDTELMTTVKRVPGGQVSNWMIDNLAVGDVVELMPPTGLFCLRDGTGPVLGFSGGSGITPILSLAKSTLAATDRGVRLLCADRDRASAIFTAVLDDLAQRYPGRLSVLRHLDDDRGLLDPAAVKDFVGPDVEADAYVCGPEPFMDLVAAALPGPGRVFTERFGGGAPPPPPTPTVSTVEGTVTIVLGSKRASVPRRENETLLESARRAGLSPPFSCEAGNCATCMARLVTGEVKMRVNDVLTEEEIAEGYILTCQGVPTSDSVSVRYE
jgi:3-ketosteroid 9alpha-monooxygenase subunit B